MSDTDTAGYARLKHAFLELADLDPTPRAARLREIEADSPTLAAALLRQLEAATQTMPLLDRAIDASAQPQLPRYRVLRELGRGGMGVVWLAERTLGDARQTVALKQIAHAHWNEDDLRRFQRERRILAALDHPNIAALVDGGADARGDAFLATQYVDGERLDDWCESQALPLRARIMLMRQVVAAVAYAHAKLVVHRDLKPANILVSADGAPKLLDFGIARALHEDDATRDGPSQMTLSHAAPEQVASDGGAGGVSVDVYALGVLLYGLLARGSPYAEAKGTAALIHAILHVEPVPPSRAPAAVAGVDADLDAICLKALRKRVDERYSGANALLADLDRWLAREPVEARHGERGYRLRSFVRRHRLALVASLALLLAGVAAVAYHLAEQNRQLARVEQQRDKAQALADQFGRLFSEARPADTERGEVSARELLERSVDRLKGEHERSPATRAALLVASAVALDYLGQSRSALDAAQEAQRLALALEPADPELLADAHSELASTLSKNGDNAGAQREAAAGLALFDRGQARNRDRQRILQQQAAMFAQNAGDRVAARAAYERIAASAREELHLEAAMRSYLAAQTNLATEERNAHPERAERRLREALGLAREHGFDEPGTLLPMRSYRVVALYDQGRIDAARELMQPTLAEARAFYGHEDPWLAMVLNVAGNLAALEGDPSRADALLAESISLAAQSYGPDHALTRSSQADRAFASVLAEDWPEAERRLDALLAWLDANGHGDSPQARELHGALAYVRARRDPGAANIAAALERLQTRNEWRSGKNRWIADDWQAWLEARARE